MDKGIVIDDTFRNVAGIGMRISEIDKILRPDIKGLTKTSELFRTTADLYSNHRKTFLKRVHEIEEYRVKLLADLVSFDIYEAVILLDAYLALGKNGASKAYAARLVSAKLRALAISRGCVINEAYRSDTGIMGRFRKMEEAYQADMGCADVPQVFTDAIRLFRFNRSEYKQYLKKANALIGKVILPEDTAKKEKEKQKAKESAPVQKTKYVKTKTDRKLKEVYPKTFIAVYDALELRWYSDPTGVAATTIYQDLKKKYPRKNIIEVLEGASWAKEIRTGKDVHVHGVSYMSTQETNEKEYFAWLEKRIPLSQYSMIKKSKNAITMLLMQKLAFKKPLFLIENAEDVSKNVSKVPKCFSNVKLRSAAIQMVTMYATYLEEMTAIELKPETVVVDKPAVSGTPIVKHSSPAVSPDKRMPKENTLLPQMEEIVLKADMEGMSYDEIRDSLRITMAQTKQLVAESKRVVDVKGKLIHEEAFIDWEEGADALEAILDKLMQKNNGYISVGQLFEYARAEMNMFLNDNDICDERSVYDIARHLFEKAHYHDQHYSFVGNMHISRPNEKICSNLDLFKKYAADQGGVFRYTGLIEYLESVGVGTGNLRMQMRLYTESIFFNYDEDVLIFSETMNMDEAWEKAVNEAVKDLFADVGDHIVLRQIPEIWYDRLPALPGSRPWTPLLLQSILRFYSKEFNAHTIHAMDGQSIETLHTMLVENSSPIQNFGDVVISCLLENEVEQRKFKAEDLRLILVKTGILHGSELIWNMPKALKSDSRFAWDVKGENVTVMI